MTVVPFLRCRGPRAWGADAGLVVLALCPAVLMQSSADGTALGWALLAALDLVIGAALVLRRRAPLSVFLVVLCALVTAVVIGAAHDTRLSSLAALALGVCLYNVGSRSLDGRRTMLALCGAVVVVVAGAWANHLTAEPEYRGGSDVLAVLAALPLAWALGNAARTQRANLAAAARQVDAMSREHELREQQAAQQERVRIAGEMHDVVAHSLTLLVVRAETLRARGGELPDWARPQIDGLAVAGRQAGGELRDLLRVLRGPEDNVPLRPLPGLGELLGLLDSGRAAGARIDAGLTAPENLPRPVQLTVYRVVQESLTNARRHAPGAPVRVTVRADTDVVRCEVENARPEAPGEAGWGAGLGLAGMRERVEALGGLLRAGPTEEGGFLVSATLPVSGTARDAARV
ncbi:sensor histidine kinase [Streptomyces sp. NPDC101455]|uniref:sensor histidine kinase n=1 Tax=Streptomyces sp. NPDC101455 TaxID=3366142 RepID=UPI0038094961